MVTYLLLLMHKKTVQASINSLLRQKMITFSFKELTYIFFVPLLIRNTYYHITSVPFLSSVSRKIRPSPTPHVFSHSYSYISSLAS